MHISFIMDGNGRWAQKRGIPRFMGHKEGGKNLRHIVESCVELGIQEATFYAFSTENWKRPRPEVNFLLGLMEEFLKSQANDIHANNIKFRAIGFYSNLPKRAYKLIDDLENLTNDNTGLRFNVAFSYGARAEIVAAAKSIARDTVDGKIDLDQLDEDAFSSHLLLPSDPDLMIRTGGECRLSNFFLWQHSYAELIFLDTLWPDFKKADLVQCIDEFNKRNRRFGGLNE